MSGPVPPSSAPAREFPPGSRLDAYLDGGLDAAERAAFEREIEADPELAAAVALQRRLDASLRRSFAPPTPAPVPALRLAEHEEAGKRDARVTGRASRLRPLLALAAVVALGAFGAWYATGGGGMGGGGQPTIRPEDYYRGVVARGFEPMWVCTDDAQLRDYTRERLGRALTIAPEPGTTLVGWNYADGLLGEGADILLARSGGGAGGEGTPVLVLIDEAANDRRIRTAAGSGLVVHRETLGGLVLYEISPLERAVVLPRVRTVE